MDDATQNVAALHTTIVGHHRQGNRTLLLEAWVGSPGVVEGDVLLQNPPRVPLPKQHQLVETFLAVVATYVICSKISSLSRKVSPQAERLIKSASTGHIGHPYGQKTSSR